MAGKGGKSVTLSFPLPPLTSQSVDSCPTKYNVCCKSKKKKELGCFKLELLFKGDFILYFNVDMYLDFTAKFDICSSLTLHHRPVSQPLGEVVRLVPDVELCLLSHPPAV